MENDKNIKAETEKPAPTDNVQLEIETVVPSTHQKPGTSAKPEGEKEKEEIDKHPVAEDNAKKPDETPPTAEDAAEEEIEADETDKKNADDAGNNDPDDKRNDVETITPSA